MLFFQKKFQLMKKTNLLVGLLKIQTPLITMVGLV